MAKSGDDLMRWQMIAAEGLQAENIPCRSTKRVGCPSVLLKTWNW